jgi:hypothetical protein
MIKLLSNIKCHDADSDYSQSFAKFKSFFYEIVLWVQGMLVAMPLVNTKPPSNSQPI